MTRSPWLVSARFDLLVFCAPALAALALAAASGVLADAGGDTPTWAWLLFVVGIDVAHVHGTTLRVYLDRSEFARRSQLYTLVPLLGFASAVFAYSVSPATFWRCLAYLALFHFVRQQIGWTRLYRRRAQDRSRFDARLDEATVYAATLYPVAVWHTRLPVAFHWFMPGDFVAGLPLWAASAARVVWAALLFTFAARQLQRRLRGEAVAWGKLALVATTAASWWCGIVWFANDFAFTVTNVVAHGVPYMFMSWRVAGARDTTEATRTLRILQQLPAYLGALGALALIEEWLWDIGVWHDHLALWPSPLIDASAAANLIVPLLALPQLTHYVLDAYLWRLDGHNPALGRLLGLERAGRMTDSSSATGVGPHQPLGTS